MKRFIVLILAVLTCILPISCTKKSELNYSAEKIELQNNKTPDAKAENTEKFIKSLEKYGYKTNASIQNENPFLSGTILTAVKINGEYINVYEYKNNQEMEKGSKTISSDGSGFGYAVVEWINDPHIYKNGNIIVLYVGDNKEIKEVIEKILGQQFAGM